jgi:hypothetical protein
MYRLASMISVARTARSRPLPLPYPTSGIADLWAPDARPEMRWSRCWDDAAPKFFSVQVTRPIRNREAPAPSRT